MSKKQKAVEQATKDVRAGKRTFSEAEIAMTEDSAKEAGAWLLADAAIRRASGEEARDIEALRRRFANVYSADDMQSILKSSNIVVIRPE